MATKLMRLQALVSSDRTAQPRQKSLEKSREEGEELQSVIEENRDLKDRVRRTDAVLRSMHVVSSWR